MAPTGNRNNAKGKPITDALRKAMHEEALGSDGKITKRLYLMASKVAQMAVDGEPWAVKEVWDRIEGKPAQAVEMSGKIEHTETNAAQLLMDRLAGIAGRVSPDAEPSDKETIN